MSGEVNYIGVDQVGRAAFGVRAESDLPLTWNWATAYSRRFGAWNAGVTGSGTVSAQTSKAALLTTLGISRGPWEVTGEAGRLLS